MRFLLVYLTLLIGCIATYSQSAPYKFRLCWFPQAQFIGYIVADKEGYYKKQGLDLHVDSLTIGEDLFNSLENKKVDFVIGTFLDGLHYCHEGKDVVNIFQATQRSGELLIAFKKSRIRTFADLQGKSIGFWPGEIYHISYQKLLEKNGVTDYSVHPLLSNIDLFLYGGVDAVMSMTFNEYQQLLFAGYKPEEITVFSMDEAFPGLVYDGVYVRKDFYEEHPELVKAFREASITGWVKAFENPEWALKILKEACSDHNKINPENYAPFNIAAQRRMLNEMKKVIMLEGNSCILTEKSFQIGMQVMDYPKESVRYGNFMPIRDAKPVWTGLEKKVDIFTNAD